MGRTTPDTRYAAAPRAEACGAAVLGSIMFHAPGKCYAPLWQIFLVVGPSYTRMRNFLSRARVILSDFGVEHLIPNIADILPDFLEVLSIPYPVNCRQQFLFPNCVPNAGWHHVFGGLVKWGLSTLDWFAPSFYQR